jgi:hypothetical protein
MGWPGPVTHRQHEAFLAWLAMQAERMGHKPRAAEDEPAQDEMTVEQAARASKARWRGRKLRAQQNG